jgi:hypothetical protein
MIADFFPKALQGMKFCPTRDTMMTIDHNSKYYSGHWRVLNNKEDADDVAANEVG